MENQTINASQPSAPKFTEPKFFTRKTKRLIFYLSIVTFPCLYFCINYIYINIESILMAFKISYVDKEAGALKEAWDFTSNFKGIFKLFQEEDFVSVTNALKIYARCWVVKILSILFAYYVYKKFLFADLFKVYLFLPSIISSVVLVTVYKELCNTIFPKWFNLNYTLLDWERSDPFTWVMVYTLYMSAGGSILMYSGTMSSINESIVESAQLDGVTPIQEFWYITLPSIWPTFTTFTVSGLATIFTTAPALQVFFGLTEPIARKVHTVGYLIFVSTQQGTLSTLGAGTNVDILTLNEVSAIGMMITIVILPISIILRKVMTKYGPSVD